MTLKKIPEEILKRYKAYCLFHGLSMNKDLIDYMRSQGDKIQLKEKK